MIRPEILSHSWPKKPLSEAVEFLDHLRRPITARDRKSGPYPYYGANGQQDSVAEYLFDEPLILLAEDGGYFGDPERAIAYRVDGKCWVNNHAHVLRPKDNVDIGFLSRQLEHYDVTPFINGATRQKLTKSSASKIPITLPPLPEQKRIAAILDKAEAIRRKRQQAIKLADDFLRATFLDMFGDPVTNPKGWEVRPLSDVVQEGRIVTYGIVQAGPPLPEGVPYIRTGDIQDGKINIAGLLNTSRAIAAKYKRSEVNKGDIIMSIRATVGTVAPLPDELDGANLTQGTARISPGAKTNREFLLYALRSKGIQDWISKQVKGATFREITLAKLRELPVVLPPVDLQDIFQSVVHRGQKLVAKLIGEIDLSQILFKSLTQRAFRGDL